MVTWSDGNDHSSTVEVNGQSFELKLMYSADKTHGIRKESVSLRLLGFYVRLL